jgi:hypothetical protein
VSWRRALIATAEYGKSAVLLGVTLDNSACIPASVRPPSGTRLHARQDLRRWVSFPKLKGVGCVTKDLSVEGCRIDLSLAGRVGETHPVEVELPGSQRSISVLAKILWSQEGESGLRFLNMHIQDEAALAQSLGVPTHPTKENWEQIWRRSMDALTYRITRRDDKVVILDFETPNWLATFEIERSEILGDWAGVFTEVVSIESSPQLIDLRGKPGLSLDRRRSLIHLKLLRADGEEALTIWGIEQSFRRMPRFSPNGIVL